MREYGYVVEVVRPPLREPNDSTHTLPPVQQAEALSYFKARSVNALFESGWILAGDTIVSLRDRVFGKPVDRDDARRILSTLGGTTHEVITGVTLLDASTGRRLIRHEVTAVTMKTMTGDELDAYLASDAWQGKAGAYGIQDRGDAFIDRIDGSYTNVVGFPMELVSRLLAAWGLESPGGSATHRSQSPGP
jgi:septum formation protein